MPTEHGCTIVSGVVFLHRDSFVTAPRIVPPAGLPAGPHVASPAALPHGRSFPPLERPTQPGLRQSLGPNSVKLRHSRGRRVRTLHGANRTRRDNVTQSSPTRPAA